MYHSSVDPIYAPTPDQIQAIRAFESLCEMARHDSALFAEMILVDEKTQDPVKMTAMHYEWHSVATSGKNMVLWAFPESGKAVPLTTEIPTPNGWTTMGALQEGDVVFGSDGKPCNVIGISPVQYERKVYRVHFSDGTSALADADHQWSAQHQSDRRAGRGCQVVTTQKMRDSISKHGKRNWHIPLCGAVQYPEADLPVHPYVLGCWLGDGDSDMPALTYHENDVEVFERCAALSGGTVGSTQYHGFEGRVRRTYLGCDRDGIGVGHVSKSLRTRLINLGVLKNKHIPQSYLQASEEQRRELLAGLLDTDGSVDGRRGVSKIEFTSAIESLAVQVAELVRSLGYRVSLQGPHPSKIDGVVVGRHWHVAFSARDPVFRMKRKLALQKLDGDRTRLNSKVVTAIEPVESVPVKCISVDSADHTYLMTRDYTVTHNTQQLIIARVLWILGRNPLRRIGILAAAEDQVKKIIGAIRHHIETNPYVRAIFPMLVRGKKWTDTQITVKRARMASAKDFSVCAISPGKKIQGARIDYLFIDDVLVHDNTRTAGRRAEMSTWIRSAAFSRLTRGAQVVMLANAFHHEDFAHELAQQKGWWSKKYPVLTEHGESAWPEVWPMERIIYTRDELTGATEFARAYMCQPRADEDARFKLDWLVACKRRGRGVPLFKNLLEFVRWAGAKHWHKADIRWNFKPGHFKMPKGCHVFTTVDLGVSRKDAADPSVIFTGFVWPNGTRQLLNIQRGRWGAPEIKRRIMATYRAFHPELVVVENNAAQDYLIQWIHEEQAQGQHQGLCVRGFITGRNKVSKEFGVETLATEMEMRKWVIPTTAENDNSEDKNVEIWVREMQFYSPDTHTGDCLMAAWFFREAARLYADPEREANRVDAGEVSVRVLGGNTAEKLEKAAKAFVDTREWKNAA